MEMILGVSVSLSILYVFYRIIASWVRADQLEQKRDVAVTNSDRCVCGRSLERWDGWYACQCGRDNLDHVD